MAKVTSVNKIITLEQFADLTNAILDGEYSWACVLLLQFVGEEPSSYIPYRTYYRLVKKHTGLKAYANNRSVIERKYPRSELL